MFSFFPREDKFYKLLSQQAEFVKSSTDNLSQLFLSKQSDQNQSLALIKAAKAGAKSTSLEITKELCHTFVTPFDREDIQDIADNLYRIPKTIEKIAERVLLHNIPANQGDFDRQVKLIASEAEVMTELILALISKNANKTVIEKAEKLNELEQTGDEIRNDLLKSLYNNERDIKDLLIRRDIYDMLEKVVDRFRDVASVALQIVLKHS